ncbi:hypothetical protein G5714_021843 [Onychostoma macrolepis]|uniref:Ig-like domain-containing protein n=1 Tax=Onychostoma macrolepis TaxID=369639 RepID=A0A7J6BU37_9TELE|nr:hypothetical protein G5714_021843 [Onychostoma macrolepis]
MTISSWCFICVFAVLIDKVFLQLTGVVGGSVVLPCSAEHDHELQDTEVFWRHNNSKIVHDIIKGSQTETQDSLYKNRIESFPDECPRGNFSIKLNDLTHAHAGKYICYITSSSDSQQKTVQLIINESTEKGNKTNDQENPNQEETDSAEAIAHLKLNTSE